MKPVIGLVQRGISDPRRVLVVSSLTFLVLVSLSQCSTAECRPSAEAVLAVHRGASAVWSEHLPDHRGQRCWFAGRAAHRPPPVPSRRLAVPLPAERPDFELEAALREPRCDPPEGRRLADYLFSPAPAGPVAIAFDALGYR